MNSHLDEKDPERVQGIINQAVKDMQWLKDKVRVLTCDFQRTNQIRIYLFCLVVREEKQ